MNKDDTELINRIMAMDEQSYDGWMESLSVEEMDHVMELFRQTRAELTEQWDNLLDEVDVTDMAESAEVLARVMSMR